MNTENTDPTGQGRAEVLSSAAAARRRVLLKSINKGAVVLAAAVPIQTLAGQNLLTYDGKHQCSVSGMFSGVHSATPGTLTCGGYSPGWWGQKNPDGTPKHWPASAGDYNTLCVSVFKYCTLRNTDTNGTLPTLWQIMEPKEVISRHADTDEFHWVCAWLNALSGSFNFPYTAQQVLDFYNKGPGTKDYQDALTFFKTYMEQHAG